MKNLSYTPPNFNNYILTGSVLTIMGPEAQLSTHWGLKFEELKYTLFYKSLGN